MQCVASAVLVYLFTTFVFAAFVNARHTCAHPTGHRSELVAALSPFRGALRRLAALGSRFGLDRGEVALEGLDE